METTGDERRSRLLQQHERIMRMVCTLTNDGKLSGVWQEASEQLLQIGTLLDPTYTRAVHADRWHAFTADAIAEKHHLTATEASQAQAEADQIMQEWSKPDIITPDPLHVPTESDEKATDNPIAPSPTMAVFDHTKPLRDQLIAAGWPKDGDLVAARRKQRYDGSTESVEYAYLVSGLSVITTATLFIGGSGIGAEGKSWQPTINLSGYYPGIDERSYVSGADLRAGDTIPSPPDSLVILMRAEDIAQYRTTTVRTAGWAQRKHRELTERTIENARQRLTSMERAAASEVDRGTRKKMPRVLKDGRERLAAAQEALARLAEYERTPYSGPKSYDPRFDQFMSGYSDIHSQRAWIDAMEALDGKDSRTAAVYQQRADDLWREHRDKKSTTTTTTSPSDAPPAATAAAKLQVTVDRDTRDNSTIYVARIPNRVDRQTYDRLSREVKRLGGYYSSYKKGFLFRGEDPTDKLKSAGLADTMATLADEAISEDMTLGDGRLSRLQTQFRKLVAMYVMALCLERIDTTFVPTIDAEFSRIGTNVEMSFDVLKAQELESCRREQAVETQTPTPTREAVRNTPVVDILDREWSEADFRRHTLPIVMQYMAEDARIAWENTKASIDEISKKPESFQGSKEAYLQSIKDRLDPLKRQREENYRLFTALRNKWEFQSDTPEDVKGAVWREQAQLYRQWSRRLTQEAIDVRLQDLDKQMRAAAAYEHYPTPIAIIDGMLDYAALQPGDLVLEPSAGEGNIAGRILEKHPDVRLEVVEYDDILRDILTLKGYTVVGEDFLQYQPARDYDAIIMNPPFDRGVDIEHVYHAFKMLREGGRLVAITSAAAIDGGDEANYAFREFIETRGSYRLLSAKDYMGPAGKLTNGRQISISVGIVTVTKQPGDSFGRQVHVEVRAAGEGMMVYDTQGAALYLIEAVERDETGRVSTMAMNMATRQTRRFNGEIKVGSGRFMTVEGEQATEILKQLLDEKTDRDASGHIKLPKRPQVGPEGEPGLKPLRIVTSRGELMPAAPESILFSKRIADNVRLTPGQIEGTNRAMAALESEAKSFMLADGTGFGKTLQQLVVAATIVERTKKPALIFTKAPSIIETSFYPDARKLKINTPDAQIKADRTTFTGRDASGLSMKRVSGLDTIAGKALDPKTIYIASYHVFGGWKGDAEDRRKMIAHYNNVVKPMREQADKLKREVTDNRWMNDTQKSERKKQIELDFKSSPAYVKYLALREAWEKVNRDYFSELGSKFSIVISDEAHAYKNYNPDDIEDGSLQAYRGMVLYAYAERGMFCTATPADKVEHIRYLKPLGIYKTEAQYMRMMAKLGFRWSDPEYIGATLVRRGGFSMDQRIPPELVLTNISRLFENLTMAGTMVKRELSLDNFEARNIMIGGAGATPQEMAAVEQARNVLAQIDKALGTLKKCKASLINEKKWALEPFKVQKVIEITKRELLEGRQVVIFASLVNDSGPSFSIEGGPCMAVDKPSTVNVLKRELGALFGEDQIGFVTGVRKSDEETLGDDAPDFTEDRTYADEQHERSFYGTTSEISALGDAGLSDRTQRERADDIRAFQEGRKRILIATPEAGGTGISLDDTVGNAPRTIIIMTAPFSSVEVVQILGRINRAQTKSRQRAYFLWVDVPIDKRLRDIIASKLRILGAAVQGEVKKVSVEEVEFATSENAQENYDKHNVDKDGKIREHSLNTLQVIDGTKMPSRKPFVLTHKTTLGTEIEADGLSRVRYAPIRMFYAGKSGGRALLLEWLAQNKEIAEKYRISLETDRYDGPYLEARYNEELWSYMLNWMKPENTRFILNDVALFKVGDRVMAATDIIEADAPTGSEGTITRVWERKIRALDIETGKQVMSESGEQVWKYQYDYMVEFDNGERANNLENWEIVAAGSDRNEEAIEEAATETALSDNAYRSPTTTLDLQQAPEALCDVVQSLSDRLASLEEDMRQRVKQSRR